MVVSYKSIPFRILNRILAYIFGLEWFIFVSLGCHSILFFLAPSRKWIHLSRWLHLVTGAYLSQAGLALYVVGAIPDYDGFGKGMGDLGIFWAAFVLLHLGGPNTLTCLSSSDNEQWLRYAMNFLTLCFGFGLACYRRTFQQNILFYPTVCIFVAAFIRAVEKVICRFCARLTQFQESALPKAEPGVDYVELLETYSSIQGSGIPVKFEISSPVHDDGVSTAPQSTQVPTQVQIVKQAYRFFQDFQGLFANSTCNYDVRDKSRDFFLERSNATEAFRICEVELNFAFDVFYTKSILIHKFSFKAMAILNLTLFALQLLSLALWIGLVDKNNFASVFGTNFVVGGTFTLEALSLFKFLTSDWSIAKVIKQKDIGKSQLSSFYENLLNKPNFTIPRIIPCILGIQRSLCPRWAKQIPQLNLLSNSLGNIRIVGRKKFTNELRDFIFEELVIRSQSAQNPKDVAELCSARGLWILTLLSRKYEDMGLEVDSLKPWITEVEFEDSVTLWHIATTLCYSLEEKNDEEAGPKDTEQPSVEGHDHREFSKILADYLMHLLINQTRSMPPSAQISAQVIFRDTCADAKRFIAAELMPQPLATSVKWSKKDRKKWVKQRLTEACKKINEVDTKIIPPRRIMGNESKTLLFDACLLSKELQALSERQINKWEIINRVLVEMLFYSAVHSNSSEHVGNLKRGGELLTLVWLLMAHLGIGKRFRKTMGRDRRAQLVLTKH